MPLFIFNIIFGVFKGILKYLLSNLCVNIWFWQLAIIIFCLFNNQKQIFKLKDSLYISSCIKLTGIKKKGDCVHATKSTTTWLPETPIEPTWCSAVRGTSWSRAAAPRTCPPRSRTAPGSPPASAWQTGSAWSSPDARCWSQSCPTACWRPACKGPEQPHW